MNNLSFLTVTTGLLTSYGAGQNYPGEDKDVFTGTSKIDLGKGGYMQKYAGIPKGATNRNTQNYWQDGDYTVAVNSEGKSNLILSQTLHIPDIIEGYYYMNHGMFINEVASNAKETRYEGWSFTARNLDTAREGLTSSDWYRHGYHGVIYLPDQPPTSHENFAKEEQTQEMPWFALEEQCKIGIIADKKVLTDEDIAKRKEDKRLGIKRTTKGIYKSTQWREFKTGWSQIELKLGLQITYIPGYKVFKSDTGTEIHAKGEGDAHRIGVTMGAVNYLGSVVASFFTLLMVL